MVDMEAYRRGLSVIPGISREDAARAAAQLRREFERLERLERLAIKARMEG